MMLDRKFEDGAVELILGAKGPQFSPVMLTCYPHLLLDLDLLQRMLLDLHQELASVPATALKHGYTVAKLGLGAQTVASLSFSSPTRHELVAALRLIFQSLREVEDDLASSVETIQQHGLKVQHVDLISQLVTSIIIGAAWDGDLDALTMARLRNLRACCKQALSGRAAPFVAFPG